MTKEEQNHLLLKDLCARLSYKVKLQHVKNADSIVELYSIDLDDFYYKIKFYTYKGKALIVSDEDKLLKPGGTLRYKPYLFPMSSMTEEQRKEYEDAITYHGYIDGGWAMVKDFAYEYVVPYWFVDFCNKNHLDYRGLINVGLAIDCTNLNIY